jgi:hypothetical protein
MLAFLHYLEVTVRLDTESSQRIREQLTVLACTAGGHRNAIGRLVQSTYHGRKLDDFRPSAEYDKDAFAHV